LLAQCRQLPVIGRATTGSRPPPAGRRRGHGPHRRLGLRGP
jgi:hypothetical protein